MLDPDIYVHGFESLSDMVGIWDSYSIKLPLLSFLPSTPSLPHTPIWLANWKTFFLMLDKIPLDLNALNIY